MMPLVEVVRARPPATRCWSAVPAFVRQIDKLPLPVKSAPGFLVNAVLGPYMLRGLRCVDEGHRARDVVDATLVAFGMPMGPDRAVDTVGLDIAVAAGKALAGGRRRPVLPLALADKVAAGRFRKEERQGAPGWRRADGLSPGC